MSEQGDSEGGGPAKITADDEYKLEVNGFRCPDAFLTQFTPLEFEELVANFLEFDANKSGTIDIYEIRKILHHMEMDITKESAQELMNLIDVDGSGEIDFVEFCAFIALTKRGDDKYTKFGKLLEKLGSSPMGMLEQQAKARHFKTRFVLIEEREATATTPSLVVIELLIEGQWFSRDDGETKGKFEIKRFQGMGSDSRHAKDAAIKLALVKLKSYMPGAHLKDGEFPEEWLTWVSNNISRGVTAVDIIETLVRKGFKPTFNDTVMHSLITSAYFDLFLQENPDFGCESLMATTLDIKFVNWLKSLGAMGLDGQVILQTLEERDIQLRLYQPALADQLKYNQLSSLLDFNGTEPKLLDFYSAAQDGNVIAVDLFIRGDVDVNLEKMSRHGSLSRTALMLASSGNHTKVVELLIAHKANVLAIDRRGRSALHYAAITGSLESCELLMNAGAPLFLGDNQGNTPLHLATWQNHPPTVDFLCTKGQEFTRSITSNKVLVNPGQTFDDLSKLIFTEMQDLKLRRIETRRFQKIWLYEASQLFRSKMSSNVRHMIAPTCQEIMEDVLHRFDPRPETGIFVSTAVEDEQLFIPTIPSHHELTVLLQYMFRQSALDNTNHWNRTSLHLACDENKVASHRETILLLIHKHGCNVMLKDMHHKTPYDLLIAEKGGGAGAGGGGAGGATGNPSATELRENLIYENRIEKIIEIMSKFEEIDAMKLSLKRNQILEECMRRAEQMNEELWEATRLASLLKGVYGKRRSSNAIGEASGGALVVSGAAQGQGPGQGQGQGQVWSHYIDVDTKNEFFCLQPNDFGLGDHFSEFSWKLPEAIRKTFYHDTAFLFQKISHSTVLRQIQNWVTLRSSRYSIIYFLNAETEEHSFQEPSVYQWKQIARGAVFQATYGYGEEWQEYRVAQAHMQGQGQGQGQEQAKEDPPLLFYFNKLTRLYCWERPVEAVTVTPSERFCTAYKKKNRRIDQKWYTCEQCNKELKAREDAERDAAATAAAVATSDAVALAEGTENSLTPPPIPPPSAATAGKGGGGKGGSSSSMLRICEPCVYRCHRGHKGVRLVRISPISCGCHTVCSPVNRCCAQEMSTLQTQNIKAAHHESIETQRAQLYNLLMPPAFALVPKHDPVTGEIKKESGFMMCRRPPPCNPILEQLIITRSLSCLPAFASVSDSSSASASGEPLRLALDVPSVASVTDDERSIISDNSQAFTSFPPSSASGGAGARAAAGAGGVSEGSTTVYLQELETHIVGNLYSDDRYLSSSSLSFASSPLASPTTAAGATAGTGVGTGLSTSLTLPQFQNQQQLPLLSTADLIAYLQRHPDLLISNELSSELQSQGWIVVMDSEEPTEYDPGTKVLCSTRQHSIPCYGTVVRYLSNGVYLIRFFDGHEEQLSFESLESVKRRHFFYNTLTGYSSWTMPPSSSLSSPGAAEGEAGATEGAAGAEGAAGDGTNASRTFFGQPPEALELTGNDWNALKLIANERRSFQSYEEYEDPFTKLIFYVHSDQFFLEQQVLKIQNLYRIKHHKTRRLMSSWQSFAFSFQKPQSVYEEERVKAGWAMLRRRSKCLGEFMDIEQYEWEELMDEDSADFFYWQEDTDQYTWTKPQIPQTKYQTKILPLEIGEKVTFLFPGKAKEEEGIVTRIRKDDETGEDMYDVQHVRQEKIRVQWIERYRLKKLAKSGEELKLELYARDWKKQIRRQREKEKRIKLLIRQKKQQEELEKRSKVLVVKRGGRGGAGGGGGGEGEESVASQEEMEKGRIFRSRVEKSQLQEERDAVMHQKRAEAIEEMMRDMNSGKMKLSKSEMISLQRSITMRLEVEGMRKKRTAAQNVLLEKRKETKRRLEILERSLRVQEDHMTTPRSSVRRRLLRQVHFGVLRQIRGQVICEWGCGDWVMLGQEQQDHQRNYCSKRIVACPLGCMKKLTEDEWLAPYLPQRDIAAEEERNFDAPTPVGSAAVGNEKGNGKGKVTPLNQTQQPQARPANGVIVSSDSDDDRHSHNHRGKGKGKEEEDIPQSTQEYHETHECPKRLIPCPRHCLEWVCAEVLDHHMTELCVKREAKPISCRLGCGTLFGGTIEQLISAEEDRYEHETEECIYRLIRCSWRNLDGSYCAAQISATDRDTHRNEHIQKLGISTYVVPGNYVYKVQAKCFMLKVQLWGGGGGSGHFLERKGGAGGGGGFVEFILLVNPFEIFEVVVGSGGQAGVYGTEIQAITTHREDGGDGAVAGSTSEKSFDVIDGTVGVSLGGNPGGGVGYGGGGRWASGGGGGYSMLAKRTGEGNEVIAVAGGGGGGGSQNGLPGCGMTGPYPGSRIDPRNGCCAVGEEGGAAGDSGNIHFSDFPATNGVAWQGGNGCQFGAGGGGGYAGGGGGGTSPGVGGGGGGGSSFVYTEGGTVRDYQLIHGSGRMPGGLQHEPPEAVGVGEWDKLGGLCGEGGEGDALKVSAGNGGAVRIFKQGYFTS